MYVSFAIMEALALYGLVVAIILLFANPLTKAAGEAAKEAAMQPAARTAVVTPANGNN